MPQPNNAPVKQQWDMCDRCGFMFPMNQLVKQDGLLLCTRKSTCFDDLTPQRREIMIMQLLGTGVEQEGVDLRGIDRGFFDGFDETDR